MKSKIEVSKSDALYMYFVLLKDFQNNVELYKINKKEIFYRYAKMNYALLQIYKFKILQKWLP